MTMMRRLIVLRHAKSSWADPALEDHARPLNKRGRRAAPVIGAWLADNGLVPDYALLSDSVRTRETLQRLADSLPAPLDAEVSPNLYHAPPDRMLRWLQRAPDAAATVLLIGHQPGVSGFSRKLCGGAAPAACAEAFTRFPTAAAAVFECDAPRWSALRWGAARFTAFVRPRELA